MPEVYAKYLNWILIKFLSDSLMDLPVWSSSCWINLPALWHENLKELYTALYNNHLISLSYIRSFQVWSCLSYYQPFSLLLNKVTFSPQCICPGSIETFPPFLPPITCSYIIDEMDVNFSLLFTSILGTAQTIQQVHNIPLWRWPISSLIPSGSNESVKISAEAFCLCWSFTNSDISFRHVCFCENSSKVRSLSLISIP